MRLTLCTVVGLGLALGLCRPAGNHEDSTESSGAEPYRSWATMAGLSASYAEHYSSFADLVSSASAVVMGEVVAVSEGRTIQGDADIDRFSTGFLTVRVDEVLAGVLTAKPKQGAIVIETLNQATEVPEGHVILALRWLPEVGYVAESEVLRDYPELADLYTVTNGQGIWLEVGGSVRNPWLEMDSGIAGHDGDSGNIDDPVWRDVAGLSLAEMSELVKSIEMQNLPSSFEHASTHANSSGDSTATNR